jgi:hypothetical protein
MNDEVKEDEMGRACSMHKGKGIECFYGKTKGQETTRQIYICRKRIILICTLEK